MSDDPREATAGGGLSRERVAEFRREVCDAADEGGDALDSPIAQDFHVEDYWGCRPPTYRELGALLDAHVALQVAHEQLDEARKRISELEQQNDEDYQQARAVVREAEDAIAFMKQLAAERDAAREELGTAGAIISAIGETLNIAATEGGASLYSFINRLHEHRTEIADYLAGGTQREER